MDVTSTTNSLYGQTYISLLNTRKTYATQVATKSEQKSTTEITPSSTAATGTPPSSTSNAVTGNTENLLSAETDGYLIQASQEEPSSQGAGTLNDLEKNYLNDIASNKDTKRIANMAELISSSPDLIGSIPSFKELAGRGDWGHRTGAATDVQKQREALYNSEVSKGTPPAEIIVRMLEHNANLPQNYGDSLEQPGLSDTGAWNKHQQAMADYLKQAIAQANAAQASDVSQTDAPIASDAKA